jgi:hypothetical protein
VFHRDRRVALAPRPILTEWDALDLALATPAPADQLLLIGRREQRTNNSWMHNVPAMVAGSERCLLLMHPDDAAKREVRDGERVVLESRVHRGEVRVRVSDEMAPGVTRRDLAETGWKFEKQTVLKSDSASEILLRLVASYSKSLIPQLEQIIATQKISAEHAEARAALERFVTTREQQEGVPKQPDESKRCSRAAAGRLDLTMNFRVFGLNEALARARIPEQAAAKLAGRTPPVWVYLHGLKSPLSSTALRAARRRP